MIRLGINVDHVATVRQARRERYPDPVQAAVLAELGGADNITCHLREDRRHINDRDVRLLKETIKVPLNFEMGITDEMLRIALELRPQAVTLVPEGREELTTEGGLAVEQHEQRVRGAVELLKEAGILVSLFIESDLRIIDACKRVGADAIEIHTGPFCHTMEKTVATKDQLRLVQDLRKTSAHAAALGMQVHFGHGLNYQNAHWLQFIPEAEEANIGHAIVGRAIFTGMKDAVSDMKSLLNDTKFRPLISHISTP